MRALRSWSIAVLIAISLTAGTLFFALRTLPVDVEVIPASFGVVEEKVVNTKVGSVRSRRESDLSVTAAGRITAMPGREGMAVKAGELLLQVDRREPEAALESAKRELGAAEAMVEEAEARLNDAIRERARLEQLRQTDAVREADIDAAATLLAVMRAGAHAAEARVEARRAEVERARVAVEKCDVYAPFDGVIVERFVEMGEWATPGLVVLRLTDTGSLYVRAQMDEVDLADLEPGLEVWVTLDPWKKRRLKGTVSRVSPVVSEVEAENRTIEIEAELVSGHDGLELRPGTSADVEVVLRRHENCLRVPAHAILEGDRVLVAGGDGRAAARTIQVGLRNWEFAEVLSGLNEGEPLIVTLENENLVDGARIRVKGGR